MHIHVYISLYIPVHTCICTVYIPVYILYMYGRSLGDDYFKYVYIYQFGTLCYTQNVSIIKLLSKKKKRPPLPSTKN